MDLSKMLSTVTVCGVRKAFYFFLKRKCTFRMTITVSTSITSMTPYTMDLVVWELSKFLFCYAVAFEGKLFKHLVKKVGCGTHDTK